MNRVTLGCGLILAAAISGCGGPRPVPVKGSVTYKGKPLANVNVVLIGNDGARAHGETDSSGSFSKLTTSKDGDGAVPGDYSVVITPKIATNMDPQKPEDYAQVNPRKQAFPPKYSDVVLGRLKVTVSASEENELKIELKD